MSAFVRVSPVLERADHMLFFGCPGCQMLHGLNVELDGMPRWHFDGNLDKPTFSPSVLVQFNWGEKRDPKVCHSFVRNGRIEFLDDCTHHLAGQTVDLPNLDEFE